MSISVLRFRFPGLEQVGCAFQLRSNADINNPLSGGTIVFTDSIDAQEVRRNRQELLKRVELSAFAEVHQVHGDDIIFEANASTCETASTLKADGLTTSRPGLGLLIKTADCQPLLLAHRSGRYVAALHVGWRGNRLLFPYTGLRRFCQHYQIKPEDCLAVRGPSLGPAKAEFIHFGKEWGEYFRRYFDLRKSTMDLWTMTRDQLMQAGMLKRNIYSLDICTASNPELFFSYRHDHACGRQASLIWIEPEA